MGRSSESGGVGESGETCFVCIWFDWICDVQGDVINPYDCSTKSIQLMLRYIEILKSHRSRSQLIKPKVSGLLPLAQGR